MTYLLVLSAMAVAAMCLAAKVISEVINWIMAKGINLYDEIKARRNA